jgi:hypothetical protein
MTRNIPKIFFSKSNIMHHAGYYDGEVIVITTDFPLWFVVNIGLHEFGHWIIDELPIQFELKYNFTMKMENFAIRMVRLLPRKYQEKNSYWKSYLEP